MHLTGLRLLAPHLTAENSGAVLAEAAGKSTRQIEEMVARLAPRPPVPTVIRKVPTEAPSARPQALFASREAQAGPRREERRAVVAPLAEETFKFQFTATRACRDKLRQAQDLLRYRIPNGDVGAIVEQALDLLIDQVKKERFAAGRRAGKAPEKNPSSGSRHIPDAIKRAVYERDGGRCAFTDENGRRCRETGMLEFDHLDGFARTRVHHVDRIRLACHAHNQHAAEEMYGRSFMERARARTGG